MAGLRAVRLLHDLEVDGKKLVAKVDAKNKLLLDNYKEEEIKNGSNKPETEKQEDDTAMATIKSILDEHRSELSSTNSNSNSDSE